MDREFIPAICMVMTVASVICLLFCGLLGLQRGVAVQLREADAFEVELELSNYARVTEGIVDGPALIIPISREAFGEMAQQNMVWRDGVAFYIFNEDMTIAYRYTIPFQWTFP